MPPFYDDGDISTRPIGLSSALPHPSPPMVVPPSPSLSLLAPSSPSSSSLSSRRSPPPPPAYFTNTSSLSPIHLADDFDLEINPHYLATPIQRSYFVQLADLFESAAPDVDKVKEDGIRAEGIEMKQTRLGTASKRASMFVPVLRRNGGQQLGSSFLPPLSAFFLLTLAPHKIAVDDDDAQSSCCGICTIA